MAQETFKITLNRIPQVLREVEDKTDEAVDAALKVGQEEAVSLLRPGHGVDTGAMEASIDVRKTGKKEGEIFNPAPYGRYVEFGTTFMDAIPHMRPASQKMGEALQKEMADKLGSVR